MKAKAANNTSGLRNLLRCDEAQGNPACAMIWEAVIPLAPSLRELSSAARPGESPYYIYMFTLFCGTQKSVRGEQVLSWQSPGGALTTCELGNAPLLGAFPDRARALPREKSCRDFKRRYRPRTLLSF